MRFTLLITLSTGCLYQPPSDLDLVKGDVPIVAVGQCQPSRVDRAACVIDGDTFDVGQCGDDFGERIRMLGIDAPELAHPDQEEECYADLAHRELQRLITGQSVTLTFDVDCEGVFGRTLAYVWLQGDDAEAVFDPADLDELADTTEAGDDSVLVNEYLLIRGFARLYDEDFADDIRLFDRLSSAETVARSRGAGLWASCETPTR